MNFELTTNYNLGTSYITSPCLIFLTCKTGKLYLLPNRIIVRASKDKENQRAHKRVSVNNSYYYRDNDAHSS